MKIHLDTPAEEARIDLVPLIDVIFCILTFFLLAALQLTRQQAINVDLPKAKTGQTQMREMLIVSIDDFGQTYIDQLPVNYQQLDRVLNSFHKQNPAGLTVLYAPQNAKYAKVVEVLDKLREVGGDRVALATLPTSAPSPQPTPLLPNSGIPVAPPIGNPTQPQPYPLATPSNPRQPQLQVPPPQQLNQSQFPSPLPTPTQGVTKSPVSPAPTAPNIGPGVATPSQNVAPQN